MHHIGYLLTDGFQMLALGTQTVFESANAVLEQPFYSVAQYAVEAGMVRSSLGIQVAAQAVTGAEPFDTLMVPGVTDPLRLPAPAKLVGYLRAAGGDARRIAAVCTGAFTLADAGLLDDRRVTTHWAYARHLQHMHPRASVEADRIYIADGPVWTSAGMTAGLDMALALVEKDWGQEVARAVAHKMVMHQHRAGGQTQHSELLELAPKTDRIQNALNYARKHLARPLSVEELAGSVNLSPRQFSRVFTAETGQSPAKAIEGLRLEMARLMIEQSRHPMDTIARETGFRDRRHLREAFVRGFGVAPQSLRRDSQSSPPSHHRSVIASQP